MLALTVKAGDYITIGPDVVIQVLKAGETFRIAIDAPREMIIERSKVYEETHATPDCIQRVRKNATPPKSGFKRESRKPSRTASSEGGENTAH